MPESRTDRFKRNPLLERMLAELGADLMPAERRWIQRYQLARDWPHPVILVMGPLRSGTTLLMQWLANTGLVAYPTNLLSRFYQTPIIGAKIQLLLADPRYNFRDELGEFVRQVDYLSENGKTRGMLAPNEFWYFWRRFLAEPQRDAWSDAELRETMDTETMLAELRGLTDVFQKPFAAKGMLFNYNIPFLDAILDKAIFVQIKRDPVANAASVLEARKRQLGDESAWYSFKIPEFEQLRRLDPIGQAAGQVHYINSAVSQGIAGVDDGRKLVMQYETFCQSPAKIYQRLLDRLGVAAREYPYSGESRFNAERTVDTGLMGPIDAALSTFSGG